MRSALAVAVLLGLAVPAAADARACSNRETRTTVDRFLSAMRAGDAAKAERLFAREPRFEWYSDPGRIRAASEDRSTLRAHFATLLEENAAPTGYRGRLRTAPERARSIGHFNGVLRSGRAFKGAVSCSRAKPRLIVWSS